jgi:CheY-like chemotaxis protein
MSGEPRILVAEDNLVLAKLLAGVFGRSGFSVTTVLDGLVAWHKAQDEHFDAIVTDEQKPEMTGRELCQSLRNDPAMQRRPSSS